MNDKYRNTFADHIYIYIIILIIHRFGQKTYRSKLAVFSQSPFSTMTSSSSNCSFHRLLLAGSFNPFEKYESNWIISPGRDEHKKYLKPPPRLVFLNLSSTLFHLSPRNVGIQQKAKQKKSGRFLNQQKIHRIVWQVWLKLISRQLRVESFCKNIYPWKSLVATI